MPIHECDPWREQYFLGVRCPPDVHIPTDDVDASRLHPRHVWIYDKLAVARSQGLDCGTHDSAPTRYPVFCKPITNLKGMGVGSGVLADAPAYRARCRPGHFWMTLLTGEHVSSDWAVIDGEPAWCRHTRGLPLSAGMFDCWIVQARADARLEGHCGAWIRRHLRGYTGMVNIETIGARIIEAHLRFADQWPDLYGPGWLDAVVALYAHGRWDFAEGERREGFSVALFGHHGVRYREPSPGDLQAFRRTPGVSSVQITFREDRAPEAHSMPPGGFRLAIVNATNLAAGVSLRAVIARHFALRGSALARRSP
jgi:hypothetical protein